MTKPKINFVIDALMFICMAAIIGIGLLMKFVLLPGKDRVLKYGRNVDLFLLRMDRHEWGTIHLIIGLVLVGLLVFHIILHWRTILALYRQLIASPPVRRITALAFVIISAMLIAFPFFGVIEVREIKPGEGHYGTSSGREMEESVEPTESSIEIRGFMTLSEIAEAYNVPTDYLKMKIGLPQEISSEERLGPLRKRFGFKMSDVEEAIREYQESP